ncbi:MAG: HAD-IIB family hydrolase [Thermoflexaceae bacterium]|nr:HAD-IIB family hydrolase [Thermoflexaceae bacterium]
MAVKLVALDIDGTIVPAGADVPSPRITAAVRTLTDSGIAVVLASGRMFPGTARIARHLGLGTPVVCQQGCSVHSLDGAMLHEFPIERDLAMAVVDYARERNHVYEWFNPLRYIASRETPATTEYGHVSGITPEYMDRPETAGVRPTGVGVISSPGEASTIHRELVARHSQELHLLDFPGVTVGVGLDANKGHALSLLCRDFGIERDEVAAIGDSVNDAPMLSWAGRGYALAHSDRYALDAADEVLPDGEEPVARLLESIAHWGR